MTPLSWLEHSIEVRFTVVTHQADFATSTSYVSLPCMLAQDLLWLADGRSIRLPEQARAPIIR